MTTVADRYRIISELGKGGMGTVYKAKDTRTNEIVAIKQLMPELADPQLIERFKREGEALRELNHPNIVRMLDALEENGDHYLVIEYLPAGDLNNLLQEGLLSIERILKLSIEIADALTRAHHLNIIHRDLKPANVLLAADGTPRLSDFGIAYLAQKARVTESNVLVGTIDYLPPEMLHGETIDARADIWAFGVMLFEMLSGQRPFSRDRITMTLLAITTQPTPDLEELCPGTPIALVDLVYRMLEKDRHARIASMRHVGAALEDILQGRTTDSQRTYESRFNTPTPERLNRPKHNLPAETTPFVGRETELSELARLLEDPEIRLITLVAPGGMGKTRLALEIGQQHLLDFANGVYVIELAPLFDAAVIIPTIAKAVGYSFQADNREQKEQVLDFLGNKQMLLILDNYEHLLEGAALVTDMLKAAPQLKVLATSRQRLNQSGETIFNLQGMNFPTWETPEDALEYAAVKLFMQSARRASPNFELTTDNMDAIARICKQVQGMPLAIMLAASWIAMLSPQEIADELASSLDLLESQMSDLPERQRSIRTVFDYSWQLMTEAEQRIFMQMSIFRGGFTRSAAQTITGASLQQLMSMMNKSLIQRDVTTGRYAIHELLRQYAEQQLETAGQADAVRDAHMNYYADALHRHESHLTGHRQLEAINAINSDFENIRAAWRWAVSRENAEALDRMLEGLYLSCCYQIRQQEGVTLFELAVKALSGAQEWEKRRVWGRLGTRLGLLHQFLAHTEQAHKLAEAGLQIAREYDDRREIGVALLVISYTTNHLGKPVQAQILAEEALIFFRETGDKGYEAETFHQLSYLAGARLNDWEKAEQLSLEQVDILKALGDRFSLAATLGNLGVTEYSFYRRFDRAEAYLRESLTLSREFGSTTQMNFILGSLAELFCVQGKLDEADNAARESLLVAREVNDRYGIITSLADWGWIKSFRPDYSQALELTDEAQALVQPDDDLSLGGYIDLFRGIALCGLGKYAAAEKALSSALRNIAATAQVSPLLITVFGFSVILAYHHHQHERALTLASLVSNHPAANFWDTHPLAKQLMAYLQEALPPDTYAAAWERGKTLDLNTVVQELLAEFGQERA